MSGFRFSSSIFEGHGSRAAKLSAAISELSRLFAGHGYGQQARLRERRAAAALAEQYRGTVTAEEILDSPFLLVGTIEEMAEQVLRSRDRYGFTGYTVHEPCLDAFAPVIDRVRALES